MPSQKAGTSKAKQPKLTVKEAKLVKATAEGKNQTEAGLIADPNRQPESARVWANETLQKPTVQAALQLALEKAGLSAESVVDVVADAMKAEKLVVVGNGEDAMADLQPDHNIRLRAAQMAGKYLGLEDKPQENQVPQQVHFHNHVNKEKDEYGI